MFAAPFCPKSRLATGYRRQLNDPTRPVTTLRTAWTKVRDRAKVVGRWHDNRHALVTELAEPGAGDEVITSIAGTSRSPCSRAIHTFEWTPSGAFSATLPRAGAPPTRSARRRPNSGRSRRKPSQ